MLKKFLKNKKGDFAILGVLILPVVVTLAFTIIFGNMKANKLYKQMQTTADNGLLFFSKQYGQTKLDVKGYEFCDFDSRDLRKNLTNTQVEDAVFTKPSQSYDYISAENSIAYQFQEYIKNVDGYNYLWQYSIKIDTNEAHKYDETKNENNKYLSATIIMVLPNVDTGNGLFGTCVTPDDSNSSYWYKNNQEHWAINIETYKEWQAKGNLNKVINGTSYTNPNGLIVKKVEVSASCL